MQPLSTEQPEQAKSQAAVQCHAVTITASDGYVLGARCYTAAGAAPTKGRLLVAGGTAVPQGFYRRFAHFACDHGYQVWTFDYRGIGASRPSQLRGFEMQLTDWARLDLAAMIDHLSTDAQPLVLAGHSFAAHAFGLLPNHQQVRGFFVCGATAGWHGYMSLSEQLKVQLMWRVLLPAVTRVRGYCAASFFGIGEDLPKNAFYQWRHWSGFPRYFFDDPHVGEQFAEHFAQVTTPIVAANALDDPWAPPASRDALIAHYQQAPLQRWDLPESYGHMGYFRAHAQPLWRQMLQWFDRQIMVEPSGHAAAPRT